MEDHHPGHFELMKPFLKDALEAPKYILEDAPNTGLILKAIDEQGINLKVVLRIHTSSDPDGFKNSIISAWHIRDKEHRRLICNKKILYKQESVCYILDRIRKGFEVVNFVADHTPMV